ncbi:hypothetical protein EVG20_g4832 [Dentipellis fragilis]|uniref:DUF7918 domain-containing protein n=1 Tax=Dentipellis fragilis TaxID=205917 RepID=A0A4Y9YX16_9AGAM|nr:hypothetical protein EVG20_g4832 [Dentipellis fragilis]
MAPWDDNGQREIKKRVVVVKRNGDDSDKVASVGFRQRSRAQTFTYNSLSNRSCGPPPPATIASQSFEPLPVRARLAFTLRYERTRRVYYLSCLLYMPLEHRDFAVHISCDGKEIPHYRSETLSEKQISCWIPSEVGKEFAVHYEQPKKEFGYGVKVYCDGRLMRGKSGWSGMKGSIKGVRTSPHTISAFMFSNVKTHDDDSHVDISNDVDVTHIGVIEVRIFRAELERRKHSSVCVRTVKDLGSVSELSKKGGLHQVSLGKACVDTSKKEIQTDMRYCCIDPEDKPYASFLFHHRPAALLQAMGVMPRPQPTVNSLEETLHKQDSTKTSAPSRKRQRHEDDASHAKKHSRLFGDRHPSSVNEDVKPDVNDDDDSDADTKSLEENIRRMQAEIERRLPEKSRLNEPLLRYLQLLKYYGISVFEFSKPIDASQTHSTLQSACSHMPLGHRGFAVHISCDGKEIPHYRSEVLSEVQVSCWIPSEAGKEFIVCYEDIAKEFDFVVRVYCDGRYMYGYGGSAGRKSSVDGVRTSLTTKNSFVFSNVTVHDEDDDGITNGVNTTHVGVVEIRIFHAYRESIPRPPSVSTVNNLGSVPERSKKGGLHQVSLGKATAVEATPCCHWYLVEPEHAPYASFLFQHRPAGNKLHSFYGCDSSLFALIQALLQAMGIMPRPPPVEARDDFVRREDSPESSATTGKRRRGDRERGARKRGRPSGNGQSESEEDIKPNIEDPEETARISSLQENIRRMQAELESLTQSTSGHVKSERAPSPIFVGPAAGTVIDLTND